MDTVTAPNGAVTTRTALDANALFGLGETKVAEKVTEGVYALRGWGIASSYALEAPNGWIIIDTGDSTRTAAEMRESLERAAEYHGSLQGTGRVCTERGPKVRWPSAPVHAQRMGRNVMRPVRVAAVIVGLAGWTCAFGAPKIDAKVWDTQVWEIAQTSKCEEADTSTNYTLCFASTATQAEADAACRELCGKARYDPVDGHDRCPKGYSCSCTATRGEPGPCSCSDATRTLDKGC